MNILRMACIVNCGIVREHSPGSLDALNSLETQSVGPHLITYDALEHTTEPYALNEPLAKTTILIGQRCRLDSLRIAFLLSKNTLKRFLFALIQQ